MSIKFIHSLWIMLLLLVFTSCSTDEEVLAPLENNPNPPGMVKNVQVENLPGQVRLTYTLPEDQDLLYVAARYQLENGKEMEVKASYYSNNMVLPGFAGTSEREVKIYAVNRSEVESAPVNVTVSPLRAPIFEVFESLEVQPDFGGLRVSADNSNREDLAILIMEKNENNEWEPLPNSIYTSSREISQSIRGYDTMSRQFAITVRDRWLNTSDTLFKEITPLYETLMPKSDYSVYSLPNDAPSPYPVYNLWDGQFQIWWGSYHTDRTVDIGPHLVTFDIGQKTKLSRVKIWHFPEPIGGQLLFYYLGAMKEFRIWGSNTPDSDLSSWTLLGTYKFDKPSGLPYGQETNEDYLNAIDGNDYEIPLDKPAVRYIRIESLENWVGGQFMAISEVHVYGNPNIEE